MGAASGLRNVTWNISAAEADLERGTGFTPKPLLRRNSILYTSHKRICRMYDQDRGAIRYHRPVRIDKYNDEAYHALVNYITAILIRLLLRSMHGKLWVDNCIAVLAKFSAKLKVAAADLPQAFDKTLQEFKDTRFRVQQSSEIQEALASRASANSSESDDDPFTKQQKGLREDMDTSGGRYFLEMDAFRHPIHYVAFNIGLEVWKNMPNDLGDVMESHTTMAWSSKPFAVEKQSPGPDPSVLNDSIVHNEESELYLTNMALVITAMVPYLMYCGVFASALTSFAKTAVLLSDPSNPVRYYKQCGLLTAVRIQTSACRDSKKLTTEDNRKQSGSRIPTVAQAVFDTDLATRTKEGLPYRQLDKSLEIVTPWIIDEKAIIIHHGWYSLLSLGACALLVAIGIAFIALGDKATGVDPSNLTTLSWAAAGFLMIYFKSRRVQDWPWRDFLRGRIVCRSISEVHSVTGINPQILLGILLRRQSQVFLKTRGPFNTLFTRKAEDGFSIDVPLHTRTVISGGYIFVRVDSMSGPALIAVDAHNLGFYDSIFPTGQVTERTAFICQDIEDAGDYPYDEWGVLDEDSPGFKGEKGKNVLPLYPIRTNTLQWFRVRGVFTEPALFD
ncbi:hypothetical protein CCUS01_14676 [Colletotrichum cuscutae]|uniref:Uncharacterized protein n=1 Tax=Colletotrichum cuscutae TaxID=1209917 RepID=A0AAJ0DKZ6_9PEZI|nr:hypothetical protein CCUS01_14676 [Colletotrichum cuscutae]